MEAGGPQYKEQLGGDVVGTNQAGTLGQREIKRRQKRFLEMTTASVNRMAGPEEER